MIILGIETSCDETAAAIIRATDPQIEVLSNIISSQIKLHSQWGGVVPNLAAREHLKNILPVIESSLKQAAITPGQIDLIAVTKGPGLIPALLIGSATSKTLSYLWQKPLIGVHHIEGHIYANFLERQSHELNPFPLLALVVSGGHTQLILMKHHLNYEIIGETLDDAAGEAFDKVARILGLPYPGGPMVAEQAALFTANASNRTIELPRPMLRSNNLNFSFSGLKTSVLYLVRKNERLLTDQRFIGEVCHEFQQAVIDVLIAKTLSAAQQYHPKTIIIAGGVSANQQLRHQLSQRIEEKLPGIKFAHPKFSYSLDNAAMIAAAGYYRWLHGSEQDKKILASTWKTMRADANIKISD